MIAQEIINPIVPLLHPNDNIGRALELMHEYRVGQLVLAEDGQYRGIISEDALLDYDSDDLPLADVMPQHQETFVRAHQHAYELLQISNQHELQVLPVVEDETNRFLGTILVSELLTRFADSLGIQETGAVVVLKMSNRDYSLSEVSRLIETNNTRILSSFFVGNTNSGYDMPKDARLTLKLNRTDIMPVLATLERFGYDIEATYANANADSPDQERLANLMRYLSI